MQEAEHRERERSRLARSHAHAVNAENELASVLRTVKSADVRETVLFALDAWSCRRTQLERELQSL